MPSKRQSTLSMWTQSDSNGRTVQISRPFTSKSRPRTSGTSTGFVDEVICAITESRGISPTVGLSFINCSTCEAVLCQFTDTQTYARVCHKIKVFNPTEILYSTSSKDSKLIAIIEENLETTKNRIAMTDIARCYWSDTTGMEYIQHLSFPEDSESLKMIASGNFYATCCFAAALKFIEMSLERCFSNHTLRIKFEPPEGSMMIDLSTIKSLELIQNLQDAKSKESLMGTLNDTLTKMGARFFRSNLLQPSTDERKLTLRLDAVSELATKEDTFLQIRNALKPMLDTDRILAALVIESTKITFDHMQQSVNNVLMLKTFVDGIKPVWQGLATVECEELRKIRDLCHPDNYTEISNLIDYAINPDISFSTKPIELANQRVYAVKAGTNGFLDVARQAYKEINEDINDYVAGLKEEHQLSLEAKFDSARSYYLHMSAAELEGRNIPKIFINIFRKKKNIEFQTLELVKMNQKFKDAQNEVITTSDRSIQALIIHVRAKIHPLFKISEAIALLDVLTAMAHVVTVRDYVRPELTDALVVKAGRHPIKEKINREKFVPNDIYATQQHRFQIITGCNMSGKSTYIRSIALMSIMAQIGSFVPAEYASFPIFRQLSARLSTDDSIEANMSTFACEMREMAFILRNVEPKSLIIIDELGRGTSTRDGLAIAISVAEALIESQAFVWFVTHFRELPRILAERAGVVNLHLAVDLAPDLSRMQMTYRISNGYEEEKFYGLVLAKVVGLPQEMLEVASEVSQSLHARNEAKKSSMRTLAVARRRKLVLSLREQLTQASQSRMGTEELREWLRNLQNEFAIRMRAIDEEVAAENADGGGDMAVDSTDDGSSNCTQTDEVGRQNDEANVQHGGFHSASDVKFDSDCIENEARSSSVDTVRESDVSIMEHNSIFKFDDMDDVILIND